MNDQTFMPTASVQKSPATEDKGTGIVAAIGITGIIMSILFFAGVFALGYLIGKRKKR